MNEQPLLPQPEETSKPAVAPPQAPDRLPWLYGLGFLILAGAVYYVWQNPATLPDTTAHTAALQSIQQHLTEIDGRLSRLEQRPSADLAKITARLDALDGRVGDQTQLATRMDTLSGRIESLSGRDQSGIDATKQSIDALTARVAAIEAKAGNVDAAAKRINRIARLQEASFALSAGRPVGDVPNAPAALVRYAHAAPPTEEQLRIRFLRDQQAALAVKQPEEGNAPFVDRVWEKAQGLITIRRGDDVVIGNESAVALNRAQADLEAGDLRGAVAAVESLKGQPAQAMAAWLTEAKALLGARSALSEMADQA